jgi:hypothetical protein
VRRHRLDGATDAGDGTVQGSGIEGHAHHQGRG